MTINWTSTINASTTAVIENSLRKLFFVSSVILLTSLLTNCTPRITVLTQPALSVAKVELPVAISEKAGVLKRINKGELLAKLSPGGSGRTDEATFSLLGEPGHLIFDVSVPGGAAAELTLEAVLPAGWPRKIYRQALLNDWYSANPRKENVTFYGDALLPLPGGKLKLRADETARIVVDYVATSPGTYNCGLSVGQTSATTRVEVEGTGMPATPFPSILFNSNNYQSSGEFVDNGMRAGMTHLQVNYIPEVKFDHIGRPVSKINVGAVNSTGFRGAAVPWLKAGNKICLFWQPRHGKLAPLEGGGYLTPHTPEWETAFIALLRLVREEVKLRCPDCTDDATVLYLADEFSGELRAENDQNKYLRLLRKIKKEIPDFPTFITFGFYTSAEEVALFTAETDINALHFALPEQMSREKKIFNPRQLREVRKRAATRSNENWAYQVGQGKTTDVREFLIYPMAAAFKDNTGFSWWAFLSHQGSSWVANDGTLPDYSLVYNAEKGNPVFEAWNTGSEDRYFPSMRLFATRMGLDDSRIIRWLRNNYSGLSTEDQAEFLRIEAIVVKIVSQCEDKTNAPLPSLNLLSELRTDLRKLFIAAQPN